MQNAAVSGLALGALLAYVGVFVVLKKMSFFGDGIAHASLAGVAAAVLLGADPAIGGVAAALVFAALIFALEEKFGASGDAAIGIIFTSGMALGLVLMWLAPGTVRNSHLSFEHSGGHRRSDCFRRRFSAVLHYLFLLRKRVGLLALNEELAVVEDKRAEIVKFFFYLITAASVALGIKLLV
jgi:ABC-type Mn2+/Zn2+ transport system permease subunit